MEGAEVKSHGIFLCFRYGMATALQRIIAILAKGRNGGKRGAMGRVRARPRGFFRENHGKEIYILIEINKEYILLGGAACAAPAPIFPHGNEPHWPGWRGRPLRR